MIEKLKEKLFNNTQEGDISYIIAEAEKSFKKLNDREKEYVINELGYLNQGELRYIGMIESVTGLSENNGNDDIEDIIKSYKEMESISKETWDTINSKYFAEMSYEEGEGISIIMEDLINDLDLDDKILTKDGVDFFGVLEKDLKLDDGSFIKKDTEFVIDGFKDGKYEIHFAKEEGNIYHNKFGDQYYFTSKEINQFAKVEGHEHSIAFDNIGIGGEFHLSVKELNIVASTDYEEIKNTILSDTPGDKLSYLENQGVNLDDYLHQYLKEVEENIAEDESFISFGKYLSDDIDDQLEMEYDKASETWNNIDVKPFKNKIYERISESIDKFYQVSQDEIETFLQGNELREGVYIYYKDSPEEYRLISSIEELKEYITDYMNEDDTFNEDVEQRWSNKDLSEWCECNDIEISKKNPDKSEITTDQLGVLEDKNIYYYYDGQSKPIRLGTVSDIVSSVDNKEEIDHFVLSDEFIRDFNFEKNEDKEIFNKNMAAYCILKNPIANDFKKVNACLGLEEDANIHGFKTEKDIERARLMKQNIER